MAQPISPKRLFYSYAHKDEDLRKELEEHLALLRRQGYLSTWQDRMIDAGAEWQTQISEALENADIVLLLVSASFLASDYCFDIEMKRALARDEAGTCRVIPIIVRPCDWHSAPFGHLQGLPKDGKPVSSWPQPDEAWLDVARGIRRVAERP
jgi:hypothetical protein